jgi:hypothetical protein
LSSPAPIPKQSSNLRAGGTPRRKLAESTAPSSAPTSEEACGENEELFRLEFVTDGGRVLDSSWEITKDSTTSEIVWENRNADWYRESDRQTKSYEGSVCLPDGSYTFTLVYTMTEVMAFVVTKAMMDIT